MKLKCLNCGHEFDGSISKDGLGWHSFCSECRCSFDVDVPDGKIVMAFTDPLDTVMEDYDESMEEDNYKYFTDNFTGECIHTYYAFDTAEEFIAKWLEIYDKPNGMWYWCLNDGVCFCSGACDPNDIEIFKEYFEKKCAICGEYHFDNHLEKKIKEQFDIEIYVCSNCYSLLNEDVRYEYICDNGFIDEEDLIDLIVFNK